MIYTVRTNTTSNEPPPVAVSYTGVGGNYLAVKK
jgi:hypothetical protein